MVGYLVVLTISASLYALFALGLNLQWGFTGLINFGHVGFMIVGAYTTVLLSSRGVFLDVAVLIGAAIASLLGLLIGLSTLRLREDYLSIVTIGVSELLRLVALNEEWLTKGAFGVQKYPLPLDGFESTLVGKIIMKCYPLPLDGFESTLVGKIIMIGLITCLAIFATWQLWQGLRTQNRESKKIQGKSYRPTKTIGLIIWGVIGLSLILTVYVNGCIAISNYNYKTGLMLIVLSMLSLVYWGLQKLVNSPWGRVLKAIREDEEIPRALGKNVFWYKLQAFMLGGSIAGIAGSFYAWQLTTVYPSNFEPLMTFNAWTIVVLGGAGNNAGTILGAIIFWAYDALTREYLPKLGLLSSTQLGPFRIMVIGLILMVLMVWRPQGLLGKKEELTLGK